MQNCFHKPLLRCQSNTIFAKQLDLRQFTVSLIQILQLLTPFRASTYALCTVPSTQMVHLQQMCNIILAPGSFLLSLWIAFLCQPDVQFSTKSQSSPLYVSLKHALETCTVDCFDGTRHVHLVRHIADFSKPYRPSPLSLSMSWQSPLIRRMWFPLLFRSWCQVKCSPEIIFFNAFHAFVINSSLHPTPQFQATNLQCLPNQVFSRFAMLLVS